MDVGPPGHWSLLMSGLSGGIHLDPPVRGPLARDIEMANDAGNG